MASISIVSGHHPPAIVLGLSPTGLYAARELGRAGLDVIGVTEGNAIAHRSRYLEEVVVKKDPESCAEWLYRTFPVGGTKPVLVPTSDSYVDFVLNYHEDLQTRFAIPGAYVSGLAKDLLDKSRFYALCEEHGVIFPKVVAVMAKDLLSVVDQVSFPCMIKPAEIHTIKHAMAGSKGWIAQDRTAYADVIQSIPLDSGLLLVQEIVPGPESDITLYCATFGKNGKAQQAFTARKLRQYPPGFGSASLVQSCSEPETRDLAEQLLTGIGYHGIAAAEFKRDARSGVLKIIEVNPRPSLWFSASSAAGKHLTLALYQDLTNADLGVTEKKQRNGVRWRYGLKDLFSSLVYARRRDGVLPPPDIAVVGPAQTRTNAVFSTDDPMPAISELGHFAGRAISRMKSN